VRTGDGRGYYLGNVGRLSAPTPGQLYDAACALSLLVTTAGETRLATRALDLLDQALDAGFPVAYAATDPDLDALHNLPAYRAVIGRRRAGAAGSR
jgi:hypothetical protein